MNKIDKGLYRRDGSPHWWIRYADRNGRICRESTGTTEKKLARSILGKRKTEVAENRHLDVKKLPNTTFYELCKQYWDMHGKNLSTKGLLKTAEDGTQSGMIEIWKKGLGNIALRELTQHKIEKFLSERMHAAELSPATYNRHLAMLKSMLSKAQAWGFIHENPTTAIKKLKEEGGRTRFLDASEVEKLLDGAGKDFKPLLVTALHTGMRRGEILSLRWADVNFQNRIITIQKSKSGKKRMIPLDDTLLSTLKGLSSRFKKGIVFPSSRKVAETKEGAAAESLALTDIHKTFRRLTDKVKLENVRFHDLRHTFASHLVMQGVDLVTVQQLLGHGSINMTMRYSHLAPEHRAKAIKVLDSAFSPATGTKTDTVAKPQNQTVATC